MGPGRLIVVCLAGLVLAMLGVWGSADDVSTERPAGGHAKARKPARGGDEPTRTASPSNRDRTDRAIAELRRVVEADPGYRRQATVRLAESARGRPIRAMAANGYVERPRILVVGCIHGTECAATAIVRTLGGCPPPGDLIAVASLNPDGQSLGVRTNGRGVDLNRNFAAGWQPSGEAGDPEHSGRALFSEPETRVARRLIRGLRPDVTIWFHQQAEPMVRAWGPSVPVARLHARLAGTPFHRLPWIDGTAPHWQNERNPHTSSFVVELPPGPIADSVANRHRRAIMNLAGRLSGDHA